MIPLDTITAALYDQVKSQAAGADARALLVTHGAGDAAIILAHAYQASSTPTGLHCVFRPGALTGESDEMRAVAGTWWCYDDADQGDIRISQLVTAIARAYPPWAIAGGRCVVTGASEPRPEPVKGRRYRTVTVSYRRRG